MYGIGHILSEKESLGKSTTTTGAATTRTIVINLPLNIKCSVYKIIHFVEQYDAPIVTVQVYRTVSLAFRFVQGSSHCLSLVCLEPSIFPSSGTMRQRRQNVLLAQNCRGDNLHIRS